MRFIIYGAGGVGCVIGGHLARTGHNVLLIGRPGHIKAINQYGLKLITPNSDYVLIVPAVTVPYQVRFKADDVVFLCMKSQNTEDAVRDLRVAIEDVPIFCFQNGVRNEETAAKYFSKVNGVVVHVGAIYIKDGEVIARHDPPGSLVMGCYPQGVDELVETVAGGLRSAGFSVEVVADVMPYKWGKLINNLANTVGAITNASGKDISQIIEAAKQELRDILVEAGISWKSGEGVPKKWPEITTSLRGGLVAEVQSSTWQSLAREQGTVETEFLNGEAVRLAEKIGRRAPVNEALLNISRDMASKREMPGKYTPGRLCALLGLESSSQDS